jgi:hypothetical protein
MRPVFKSSVLLNRCGSAIIDLGESDDSVGGGCVVVDDDHHEVIAPTLNLQ